LLPGTDIADIVAELPREIKKRIMDFVEEFEDIKSEFGTIS
jgi:hypothetical protein